MKAAHVASAIPDILKIQLSQNLHVTVQMVQQSFVKLGLYPFDADKLFDMLKAPVSQEVRALVQSKKTEIIALIEAQGEMFEQDFVDLGILPTSIKPKAELVDLLVLYRRRACILTHPALLVRELARKDDRQLETKPQVADMEAAECEEQLYDEYDSSDDGNSASDCSNEEDNDDKVATK